MTLYFNAVSCKLTVFRGFDLYQKKNSLPGSIVEVKLLLVYLLDVSVRLKLFSGALKE